MSTDRKVKDLMLDVFEFPHIPHWFSLRQSIEIIKRTVIESEKCIRPVVILVFDEKYNLLGTLTHINILKGLEPSFLKPTTKAQVPTEDEVGLAVLWDTLFTSGSKELAEKPVSEVMVPARFFVDQEDPITKAAYLMLRHDLVLLPVLENKKKLVGVVRMIEVFEELSNNILSQRGGE
ncbi:MAG: CBS domain-containing protein [Nitrospirota bacterium]|nr:CBS domain-containing protein [Nitrospirota bacterium]